MGLSLFAEIHWAGTALLELALFILALRRKLFERHLFFTIYLGALVAYEGLIWLTYALLGIQSRSAFYVYWALQAFLILFRGAAVYEICGVLLAPFLGVWRICRTFLLLISILLVVSALYAASQSGPHFSAVISTAERGLELAIVGVLLIGLAFCRYYQVKVAGYLFWFGLGFGFYSAVQVVNNTFLRHYLLAYFPVWKNLYLFSFDIAIILWCIAMGKPLPVVRLSPATLAPGEYEAIAPQVTSGLRELNARLLEMWK
jgi:hypothetical protein